MGRNVGSSLIGLAEVKHALNAVAAEEPQHVDDRVERGLSPRYVEHGKPCCLVAVVMYRLGISLGMLRQLDREQHEPGTSGGGIVLRQTRSPIVGRFSPLAWDLLCEAQARQDRGFAWRDVVDGLLRPRRSAAGTLAPKPYPWNQAEDETTA